MPQRPSPLPCGSSCQPPETKNPSAGDLGDIDLDSAERILHHCNVEQLRTIEDETAWGVIPHAFQVEFSSQYTGPRPHAPQTELPSRVGVRAAI